MRPDYALIRRLELELFGEVFTHAPTSEHGADALAAMTPSYFAEMYASLARATQ